MRTLRGNEGDAPHPLEHLLLKSPHQSKAIRLWCDEVKAENPVGLLNWLDSNLNQNFLSIHLLVGPEGGWSTLERAHLLKGAYPLPVQRIDLGAFTLRAETAALYGVSLVSAFTQKTPSSGPNLAITEQTGRI